jgi:hypothetical protein
MENVTLDAFLTTPDCLMHDRYDSILRKDAGTCDQKYGIGERVYLSPQLRTLFVHPATIGAFDVRTYNLDNTPIIRNQMAALSAIPIESYQQAPEFSKEVEKAISKERDRAKPQRGQPLSPDVANAAVVRFLDEWLKAARSGYSYQLRKFGNVRPEFFVSAAILLQAASKHTVKSATDRPLSTFMAAKDGINATYDSQQAEADGPSDWAPKVPKESVPLLSTQP